MPIPVPQNYRFAALAAGFKQSGTLDLAVCLSERPAVAAGTFTTNRFQAAPVLVGKELLAAEHSVRGVVINSGQANACTGEQGLADCRESLELLGSALNVPASEILPASTGVIGRRMDMDVWRAAVPELARKLDTPAGTAGSDGPEAFARAIMTTDAYPKLAWRALPMGRKGQVNVLGMAKGAGMICPNMATMLALVLTDAEVDAESWRQLLSQAVAQSFNRVTVDGDTSTNDTVYGLANGGAGVALHGEDLGLLAEAVNTVCSELAYLLVADAEGGSKVVTISVHGAKDDAQAEDVARTVGHSQLVKTAFYGRDPNWGRIVAAIGRSRAEFAPEQVSVALNGVPLFVLGAPASGDVATLLAASLREREQRLQIILGRGAGSYELRAADLTHEYVSINADYTT